MIENNIAQALKEVLFELYSLTTSIDSTTIQRTKKEFEGDFTIVLFPYVKAARKSPDAVGKEIGDLLIKKLNNCKTSSSLLFSISNYNVVKGYLNLSISHSTWINFLNTSSHDNNFGIISKKEESPTLIEYSSPNTNKPLHLGHIRNNLLGYSIAQILSAAGENCVKVNLVNDRGIHICKSMIAWQKFGNGETPESSGIKGDHLVGKYYVLFDVAFKKEVKELIDSGLSEAEATKQAPIMLEAQEMLLKWENGDHETRNLWKMMNSWVYSGFDTTYKQLGVSFDKIYYESETYLLGKALVQEGLDRGTLYRKEDQSVWVNLTDEGLDEKLLLRSDGTSVYMTQDLGTAQLRDTEFKPKKMVYVVGNEQNYHFDVLKLVLSKKLNKSFGDNIYHLSYGMVELPFGKMKSREGTVVDADDLMQEMIKEAQLSTEALGKFNFNPEEAAQLYQIIGLGALKYFILKIDPKKNILFNPQESIDFNGNTAPFIQYTHARICSIIRKADSESIDYKTIIPNTIPLLNSEKELLKSLYQYPQIVLSAAEQFSPAIIANYIYDLSKDFNRYYQETPIMKENDSDIRIFRVQLSQFIGSIIKKGMALLGIDVPEKM